MTAKQLKASLNTLSCYSEAVANKWVAQHPKASYGSADLCSLLRYLRSHQKAEPKGKADRCLSVAQAMRAEVNRQRELPAKARQLSVWA